MMLFEADNEIQSRLELHQEYKNDIPEYFEALEIAHKSIQKQMELADVINDFWLDVEKNDTFSATLVYDLLNQFRHDYEGDEDGEE